MGLSRFGLHKLLWGQASTLGIFALILTFHAYGAHAGPSVRVLATLPQAGGAITHHMSGDALPIGAKYRIVVSPDSGNSLAVDTLSESGEGHRLFNSDKVTPNRSIVLPAGEGWYPLPSTSGEFRILVTHGDEVTEHVIRTIDSSPRPGAPAVNDWLNQSTGDSRLTSTSTLGDDPSDAYERATVYRSAALKLALAKEPPSVFRGESGTTIFRTAAPSVVLIKTDKGIGSGIVLSKRGEMLTNWHVVDGGKFIAILTKPPVGQRMDPGEVYDAKLVKYDQVADLALIQFLHTPPNLVPLRIGDERSIVVGSSVHAIGHPNDQEWTYTQGVVSQIRTDYTWQDNTNFLHKATVIQTQTPINPGNSGGPLLDDDVAVIGVNTFLLPEKQGLNFAISVGEVKRFLEMPGNREGKKRKEESNPSPAPPNPCKGHRQFSSFIDSITKKQVVPFDTLCLGRPNVWRVGQPPEYLLWDYVGDGKIDIKIVYKFAPDVDLWIAYGSRDEVPTMFGYDYGRKGKPDRWVPVNPAHQ
jgi:S1-C subfamily serine protease